MSIPTINYRTTYFPKPDLTPIIGKPTFQDLYQLLLDLRQNAQTVHCNLGGGDHGHLGLLMTPGQYAMVSQTPYVRPVLPAPLVIPPEATRIESDTQTREYDENLRLFHETRGVEQALIQQLVTAVEDQYLVPFKNRTTGKYNGNVFQIFQYLLRQYGRVSPAELSDFDKEVTEMTYDPTTPIDLVFSKVDDLVMYGEFAQNPYTAEQAISKAYNIINNCGSLYNDYIKSWNRRMNNRTWINFQNHFRDAYNELEQTGALKVDQMGFGQANFVEEVASRVSADILQRANIFHSAPIQAPEPPVLTQEPISQPPTFCQPTANAVIDDSLIQQLLAQNKQLIESLANQNPRFNRRRQPRPATGPRKGSPRTPLPAHFNKYCWTHGRCNHLGKDCQNKAPNHKDEATIDNKMEGSSYACP